MSENEICFSLNVCMSFCFTVLYLSLITGTHNTHSMRMNLYFLIFVYYRQNYIWCSNEIKKNKYKDQKETKRKQKRKRKHWFVWLDKFQHTDSGLSNEFWIYLDTSSTFFLIRWQSWSEVIDWKIHKSK